MKRFKEFLKTCESEQLVQEEYNLIDVTDPIGGLGVRFGYPGDAKKSKDKAKTQLWRKYFSGKSHRVCMWGWVDNILTSYCRAWQESHHGQTS